MSESSDETDEVGTEPDFEWDEDFNVRKVLAHRVTPTEAEDAILDPAAVPTRFSRRHAERRQGIIGKTEAGRIPIVIFTKRGGAVRVITAYDAPEHEKRRYRRMTD